MRLESMQNASEKNVDNDSQQCSLTTSELERRVKELTEELRHKDKLLAERPVAKHSVAVHDKAISNDNVELKEKPKKKKGLF
jgi:hypothetical protein